MYKSFFIYSFLTTIALFSITSCREEDPGPDAPGVMEIEFDNIAIVNGIQRQLTLVNPGSSNYEYVNDLGQPFNINLLRYYISNIVIEGPNGERFEDPQEVDASGTKGIYLVDEANISSGTIILENVPAGTYNRISFTVGVDEDGVQEGAAGGVLDPGTCNMFWNWNSGYIGVKFEGQSPVSNGGISGSETLDADNPFGILYHIGGWRDVEGTAFVNNNKSLSYAFDTDAKVKKGEQPHVHMVFDVLGLFKGADIIDFTGNHNVHKPVDGKPLADNLPAAFAFDHIHQ